MLRFMLALLPTAGDPHWDPVSFLVLMLDQMGKRPKRLVTDWDL